MQRWSSVEAVLFSQSTSQPLVHDTSIMQTCRHSALPFPLPPTLPKPLAHSQHFFTSFHVQAVAHCLYLTLQPPPPPHGSADLGSASPRNSNSASSWASLAPGAYNRMVQQRGGGCDGGGGGMAHTLLMGAATETVRGLCGCGYGFGCECRYAWGKGWGWARV